MSDQVAVCIAINNNNLAWYDMLVPFILSLRQTDYAGHIVVIGYDLSHQKVELLRAQGISVFEGTHAPLATGRFIEVAKICEANPQIDKIALYDADIWFCSPRFDLFDLFDTVEGDAIHACRDQIFCDFLLAPLIGPRREDNIRRVVKEIGQRFGNALQAGLLAGTAKAWRDFADHVRDGLSRIGDEFTPVFGLDTTLLHLWGAKGRVSLLEGTQNFILKSGLIEHYDGGDQEMSYHSADGPVRALHMAGDIRFMNRWRYVTNRPDHALDAGQPFALVPSIVLPVEPRPTGLVETCAALGLEVISADAEPGGYFQAFAHAGAAFLNLSGNHTLTLRATRDGPELHVYMTHPSGLPSPIRMSLSISVATLHSVATTLQTSYTIPLAEGDTVTLRATSLAGQMCHATWILAHTPFIKQ